MTRFMQTLLLTIYCGLSLAEVKKSPDVTLSSAPTCKAGDADSCKASSAIDSPDDVANLLQTHVRIKEHGGEQAHKVDKTVSHESSQARSPHASALEKGKLVKSKIDNFQKVYIDSHEVDLQPFFGDGRDGAGTNDLNDLNVCKEFDPLVVHDPSKPNVKVCGTRIKMTVYMLGRCGVGSLTAGWSPTWELGACDTRLPPWTCESYSPSTDPRFGVAQSYKIEQCP